MKRMSGSILYGLRICTQAVDHYLMIHGVEFHRPRANIPSNPSTDTRLSALLHGIVWSLANQDNASSKGLSPLLSYKCLPAINYMQGVYSVGAEAARLVCSEATYLALETMGRGILEVPNVKEWVQMVQKKVLRSSMI